ncbi:MAG: DUF1592 domain-containing protein [Bryobacteraceae bacterium]|nr:DUF1592 domain-containing protein [Bryobacteraceae bacterium]MDW8376946.1 DUF1592 domain-containing protein [Bryobacterales bacterium]
MGARAVFFLPFLTLAVPAADFSFSEAQALLKSYCSPCHNSKLASGGFDVSRYATMKAILDEPRKMSSALRRVRENEMPPLGAKALPQREREQFVRWLDTALRTAACSDGVSPARQPVRRLNRNEYSATVRDLLNIHISAGRDLPVDGAGGEGFDNAAETLFLSPIHAEKYLEAAKQALHYGSKDPRSRARFLIAEPSAQVPPEAAARKILEAFLPRAFRRPAQLGEIEKFLRVFHAALSRREGFEEAILHTLQGVMVSPHFLFRLEEPNPDDQPRLVSDYEMASRLSYFLWGSMPDETLMELAAQGKLQDPAVLKEQATRMLKDSKSTEFAEQFIEQWLGTRELGRDIKPDPKLFAPYYEPEVQSGIRYEPILFFQEILAQNLSLLNLIDSKFTVVSNKLARYYGWNIEGLRQQPKRVEIPEGSPRGGLLGMAAIHAVTSLPQRTSPVLRGKWVLDALLGTPPPPPPPNVPELKEEHGAAPRTMRERLLQHRSNPACASCHNRIDPIGFGLENFDVIGRYRTEENGKPIDTQGELPDGARFQNLAEFKQALLAKRDLILRNLTAKLLGYALGRSLTLEDHCVVDQILRDLAAHDYSAHTLIHGVVLSVPFRYKPGRIPNLAVTSTN